MGDLHVSRWAPPPPLPTQAPHALVQAYRDLVCALVARVAERGQEDAPALAERARQMLSPKHPVLDGTHDHRATGRRSRRRHARTDERRGGLDPRASLDGEGRGRRAARRPLPRAHVRTAAHLPVGRAIRPDAVESGVTEAAPGHAVRRQHPHRQHGGFFFSRGRRAQVRRRRARRRHAAHAAPARSLRHLDAATRVSRAQRGEDDAAARRAAARGRVARAGVRRGHAAAVRSRRAARARGDRRGRARRPDSRRVGAARGARRVRARGGPVSLFRIPPADRGATGVRRSTRSSTRPTRSWSTNRPTAWPPRSPSSSASAAGSPGGRGARNDQAIREDPTRNGHRPPRRTIGRRPAR